MTDPTDTGDKRRLLIVGNIFDYLADHRLYLIRSLVKDGFEVHVAASGSEAAIARIGATGAAVHALPIDRRRLNVVMDFRFAAALQALVRRLDPHLVHFFTIKPIVLGKIALRVMKGRNRLALQSVVMSFPGLGRIFAAGGHPGLRLRREMVISVLRTALPGLKQFVTVENNDDGRYLREILGKRRIRGTGVDLEQFRPLDRSGAVRFLYAGRLLRSKGAHLYLQAARRLAPVFPDCQWLMAGAVDPDDPDSLTQSDLDAMADCRGFGMIGRLPIEQMPDLLASTHVVCLPTLYNEGIPRILMEAAASGCTYITSPISGWRGLMDASETGWLLTEVDVEALSQAMGEAAADPDRVIRLGAACRRRIEAAGVSDADVQRTFVAVYRAALRARPAVGA